MWSWMFGKIICGKVRECCPFYHFPINAPCNTAQLMLGFPNGFSKFVYSQCCCCSSHATSKRVVLTLAQSLRQVGLFSRARSRKFWYNDKGGPGRALVDANVRGVMCEMCGMPQNLFSMHDFITLGYAYDQVCKFKQ